MHPTKSIPALLLSSAIFSAPAKAAEARQPEITGLTRVAYDDAGEPEKQPNLKSGENHTFPGETATRAMRTAAFGGKVEFAYAALRPSARYAVKLSFFSDSDRTVQIKAGKVILAPEVKLSRGASVIRILEIPKAAYGKGTLTIEIAKIDGPNAVVSEIEILSDNPSPLIASLDRDAATDEEIAANPLPRLSPRPASIPGLTRLAVDLGGVWKFTPEAPKTFPSTPPADWKDIRVPGEWHMQGFSVKAGTPAGYARAFSVPEEWSGRRVKLRCDGVYSDSVIFVNGREIGRHSGGFTPFELDVTDAVKPGDGNVIAISALNETVADKLASGSRYAMHQLGGITRKIGLFALPSVNISALRVTTTFDKAYRDALLHLDIEAKNDAGGPLPQDTVARVKLVAPDGREITPEKNSFAPGNIVIPVATPRKWDNEHPNLYTLTVDLVSNGKTLQTVSRKVGFRTVEVRGNQMFINNTPVKLRGVCRHEVHPLTGRSTPPEFARRDAEIFREGNCNYIRTSHYPPTEEFVNACDELGLFVEVEGPFCWAHENGAPDNVAEPIARRQELEMLEAYRSHPSVTHWSMGNESLKWTELFLPSARLFRRLDPTRPINFSQWSPDGDSGYCDLGNHHYPGLGGPAKYANAKRPIVFDEYIHLNSYNRRELATDPGLRDQWGDGSALMWERMHAAKGVLGGAVWAAIDDTFLPPSGETLGYGTWGPIDGWRRPKPEYWHMKKFYSPLRLRETVTPVGEPLRFQIENRHAYSDLSEVRFSWSCGARAGEAPASGAPGTTGTLEIPYAGKSGDLVDIVATSSRGFVIDRWRVAIGEDPRLAPAASPKKNGTASVAEKPHGFLVKSPAFTVEIDGTTGAMLSEKSLLGAPELLLLARNGDNCGGIQMKGVEKTVEAFTETCEGWKASSVKAGRAADGVAVRVDGAYANATGAYDCKFGDDGVLTVRYSFTYKPVIKPNDKSKGQLESRQLGVVFRLPVDCRNLTWRAKGRHSVYPEDHIGRSQGSARAFTPGVPLSGLSGCRVVPEWPWSADGNAYGSNDFRSTKRDIIEASLLTTAGRGLRVLSDGKQNLRAWVDKDCVRLAVLDYSSEGSPPFFSEHVVPRRLLKDGDKIEGVVRLELK